MRTRSNISVPALMDPTETFGNLDKMFDHLRSNMVGFDDFFSNLPMTDNYPPHNIEKIDENNYRLTLAVAGFEKDELDVSVDNDTLTVSGSKKDKTEDKGPDGQVIFRGIANRNFTKKFKLGNVDISDAELQNGLLTVDIKLQREDNSKKIDIK